MSEWEGQRDPRNCEEQMVLDEVGVRRCSLIVLRLMDGDLLLPQEGSAPG